MKYLISKIVLSKMVFFTFSQNSGGKTFLGISFFETWWVEFLSFVENRFQHMCFTVSIAEFLGIPVLQNTSEQLLLDCESFLLQSKLPLFQVSHGFPSLI